MGDRERLGSILARRALDQVLKRGSILNTGGERFEVPEVTKSAEQRTSRIGLGLAMVVGTLLLNVALVDPGRDEESGDTTTQTVEFKSVLFAVGSLLGVGQVVRASGQGGRNVVVETTALVEGEDEESLLPLGAGTERFVDLLDESLAIGNQTAVVHGGGTNTAAGGVQVRKLGQSAVGGIGVELLHGNNLILVAGGLGPGEPLGLRTGTTSGVPVVEPGVIGLTQLLEDGPLGEGIGTESGIVGTVASGGTSNNSESVRAGRLY